MSEPKLISPMLDNFDMGDPVSEHNGIRCCPAMRKDSDDKFIVKIISVPASQVQLDALLLSGAYADETAALAYFQELTDGVVEEVQILQRLSKLEGFLPFSDYQVVEKEDETGFDIYLLSPYKKTLERYFRKTTMTQLSAINLGLDLCAALAVCRRSGYLYVNLTPNNVYLNDDKEFRIGDLGFLRLDSLKYASLPDKYRSNYTAPEIADAFSSLNTTLDIYAVGLILYQAYNGGILPYRDESADAEDFPAPAYADYEMAEIILKACARKPEDRWQDPIEMGQALVSYMQRNGANDTPIIPSVDEEEISQEAAEAAVEESITDEITETVSEDEVSSETDEADAVPDENDSDDVNYAEDDFGNLSFLEDIYYGEDTPEEIAAELDYDTVSDDVSDMLYQADDLLAHPTPDPVVAPEPIDIPMPPPIEIKEEAPEEEASEEEDSSEPEEAPELNIADQDSTVAVSQKKSRKKTWLLWLIVGVITAAIIGVGVYLYSNYYLQEISDLKLNGKEDTLTVSLTTDVEDQLLTVVCSDTYGNILERPVKNKQAVFTGLASNAPYTVTVVIDGFHHLTGEVSTTYTTPTQIKIDHFNAVTGPEDGSVILSFTVAEGSKDAGQWSIVYSAEGEAEQTVSFTGNMTTISGLTVGKEYTFTLQADGKMYVVGTQEVKLTASNIVKAENLAILSCINNTLKATWSAPEGSAVSAWNVRCYNDSGYDQMLKVTDCSAVFEGLDHTKAYTVEVTAENMSVSEQVSIKENAITITDFTVDHNDPNKLVITWKSSGNTPKNGWVLYYSADGTDVKKVVSKAANEATIKTVVPGAEYSITLEAADGTDVLSGKRIYKAPKAASFKGYNVTASDMEFKMCKTPSKANWTRYNLSSSDYTTSFTSGKKASFVVHLTKQYKSSSDTVIILYEIRNEDGKLVSVAKETAVWNKMWSWRYCELDVPSIPNTAGRYKLNIYFNGALAKTQSFKILAKKTN